MSNILLVDDHEIVRDALKLYFENEPDLEIKYEASNGQIALEIIEKEDISLVITDISMPVMDGMELVKQVKNRFPKMKMMALSMMDDIHHIKQMIALGVEGYIFKNATKNDLLTGVRTILRGEKYFSREVTEKIVEDLAHIRKPKQRLTYETPLSAREKEVLNLILMELSNQEIADKLFISIRTVEAHKRNLIDKTGTKSIAGLVLYGIEHDFDKEVL